MSGHRNFCIEGWEEEGVYNAMANLGIKLPPKIKPVTGDPAKDFDDFLVSHTLMTREAAEHCRKLIQRLARAALTEEDGK